MANDFTDPFVEFRGPLPREHIDIIDVIAQVTPGATRVSIVRDWIAERIDLEIKKATVIERVRRGNGVGVEVSRRPSGVETDINQTRELLNEIEKLVARGKGK